MGGGRKRGFSAFRRGVSEMALQCVGYRAYLWRTYRYRGCRAVASGRCSRECPRGSSTAAPAAKNSAANGRLAIPATEKLGVPNRPGLPSEPMKEMRECFRALATYRRKEATLSMEEHSNPVDMDATARLRLEGLCIRIRYSESCATAWSAPLNRDRCLPVADLENVSLGVGGSKSRANIESGHQE